MLKIYFWQISLPPSLWLSYCIRLALSRHHIIGKTSSPIMSGAMAEGRTEEKQKKRIFTQLNQPTTPSPPTFPAPPANVRPSLTMPALSPAFVCSGVGGGQGGRRGGIKALKQGSQSGLGKGPRAMPLLLECNTHNWIKLLPQLMSCLGVSQVMSHQMSPTDHVAS